MTGTIETENRKKKNKIQGFKVWPKNFGQKNAKNHFSFGEYKYRNKVNLLNTP